MLGYRQTLRELIRGENESLRALIRGQHEEFMRYQERREEEFRHEAEERRREAEERRRESEARTEELREFNREILLRNEKVYTALIAEIEEGRKQIQANTRTVLSVLDRLDGSGGLAA